MSKPSDALRLAGLIEVKVADMEARADAGDAPTATELNAVRRLVDWAERARDFEQARELTRDAPLRGSHGRSEQP